MSEEYRKRHHPNKDDDNTSSSLKRPRSSDNNKQSSGEEERVYSRRENEKSKSYVKSSDGKPVWGNVPAEIEEEEARKAKEIPEEEKEKANFGLTGSLAKDLQTGNMYNGVLLKWTEPLDAARPTKNWRFYVFKGDEVIETMFIHRQSAYLVGRENLVADIVVAHPSCSKQHAVIQYRLIEQDNGSKAVIPYIMDLESTNKTFLNGKAIEDSRYVELREKDCLKFGHSSREYVLLHDKSKT
eukprot:gene6622-13412_t